MESGTIRDGDYAFVRTPGALRIVRFPPGPVGAVSSRVQPRLPLQLGGVRGTVSLAKCVGHPWYSLWRVTHPTEAALNKDFVVEPEPATSDPSWVWEETSAAPPTPPSPPVTTMMTAPGSGTHTPPPSSLPLAEPQHQAHLQPGASGSRPDGLSGTDLPTITPRLVQIRGRKQAHRRTGHRPHLFVLEPPMASRLLTFLSMSRSHVLPVLGLTGPGVIVALHHLALRPGRNYLVWDDTQGVVTGAVLRRLGLVGPAGGASARPDSLVWVAAPPSSLTAASGWSGRALTRHNLQHRRPWQALLVLPLDLVSQVVFRALFRAHAGEGLWATARRSPAYVLPAGLLPTRHRQRLVRHALRVLARRWVFELSRSGCGARASVPWRDLRRHSVLSSGERARGGFPSIRTCRPGFFPRAIPHSWLPRIACSPDQPVCPVSWSGTSSHSEPQPEPERWPTPCEERADQLLDPLPNTPPAGCARFAHSLAQPPPARCLPTFVYDVQLARSISQKLLFEPPHGLLVVADTTTTPLARVFWPLFVLLRPGLPFAVWAPAAQPLLRLQHRLLRLGPSGAQGATLCTISAVTTQHLQALPGRTHPQIRPTQPVWGGFSLTGTKVLLHDIHLPLLQSTTPPQRA